MFSYYMLFGSFVVTSSAFHSDFLFVDQIFQNTSDWIFETSVDYTKLQNIIDTSYQNCEQANNQLNILVSQLEHLQNLERNSTKFFVLNNKVTHDAAQKQCLKAGPSCILASINDDDTYHTLSTLLIKNKLQSGHINYQVEKGQLLHKQSNVVQTPSFLRKHKWKVTVCPNKFELINNNCLLTDISVVDRMDAEKVCQTHNSDLFELKTPKDFMALNKIINVYNFTESFWLGGKYTNGKYPTASFHFCQEDDADWINKPQPEGKPYLAWYRPKNCLLNINEHHYNSQNKIQHHVICKVSPNNIYDINNTIKVKKLLHHFFEHNKGSFQLTSDGHVLLRYQDALAAPICSCPSHQQLVSAQNRLTRVLLEKATFVQSTIQQQCDELNHKISTNPYLSSINMHDKRWIGSAIRSALSKAKTALRHLILYQG